jgi:hypothetical protein
MDRTSIERRSQSAKFIEHDSHRPDVRFERVRPVLNDFWGEVVRGSYHGPCKFNRVRQHLGYSKIAYFYDLVFGKKDVLSLDISMQNFPVVNMFQCQTTLGENV